MWRGSSRPDRSLRDLPAPWRSVGVALSDTPIGDMVARLMIAGADQHAIVDAVRTAEIVALRERDASRFVTVSEPSSGALRARRYRENRKQKQSGAARNTVNGGGDVERDARRDASRDALSESASIHKVDSLNETQKGTSKKLRKKESEDARARGQRMIEGAVLTDQMREVAVAAGLDPRRCDETWREFVDYWVAIPGRYGLKSNWVATWRNRVHKVVAETGSYRNGHRRQSIAEQAAEFARELRAEESARAAGNADDLFRRG